MSGISVTRLTPAPPVYLVNGFIYSLLWVTVHMITSMVEHVSGVYPNLGSLGHNHLHIWLGINELLLSLGWELWLSSDNGRIELSLDPRYFQHLVPSCLCFILSETFKCSHLIPKLVIYLTFFLKSRQLEHIQMCCSLTAQSKMSGTDCLALRESVILQGHMDKEGRDWTSETPRCRYCHGNLQCP